MAAPTTCRASRSRMLAQRLRATARLPAARPRRATPSACSPIRSAGRRRGSGSGSPGGATFDGDAASTPRSPTGCARSGADGVVIGGDLYPGGGRLLKGLRARLGARVAIMAGEWFMSIPTCSTRPARAARGLYVGDDGCAARWTRCGPTWPRRASRAISATRRTPRASRSTPRGGRGRPAGDRALRRHRARRSCGAAALRTSRTAPGQPSAFDRYGDITPAA